jgi:hypothetical protein
VALSFRGKYHFGFIEASHWNRWLQSMNVATEPEKLPTIVVLNGPKEQYYLPMEKHTVTDEAGINQFLGDIQRGVVKAQGPSEWSPSRLIKKLDEWLTDNFTVSLQAHQLISFINNFDSRKLKSWLVYLE